MAVDDLINEISKNKNSDIDDSNNSDDEKDDYISESNKNIENDESDYELEEDEVDNSNMRIPIMLILCNRYINPKTVDKIKYFKEHFKKCKMCNITNNNNSELSTIIDSKDIYMINIDGETKEAYENQDLYESALIAYHELKVFKVFDDKRVGMKILNIGNYDPVYMKCFLIIWSGYSFSK